MANLVAQFRFQLGYTDQDGNYQTALSTVNSNYLAQNHGSIDVPDMTAAATVYNVPFGSIAVDSTCGMITNKTGQPLKLKINGAAAASQTIPDGGVFAWANPAPAGATPVLALSLETTAIQAGQGSIAYHTFGDPV